MHRRPERQRLLLQLRLLLRPPPTLLTLVLLLLLLGLLGSCIANSSSLAIGSRGPPYAIHLWLLLLLLLLHVWRCRGVRLIP
jgi:hypothetical protein